MSHEITATDNVLLHTERAWHNLGIVVREDMTPRQALTACGLDWGVVHEPVFRYQTIDGERKLVEVESHVLTCRADNEAQLGMVSKGYKPIQNVDLADFAESLATVDKSVVVETCGSIRGGRKVWFLCRADSFTIGKTDDEVVPYLLVSNGHDGTAAMRVTPTTVRVVCSNTLHMVIPQTESQGRALASPALSFQHIGDIHKRVAEAKDALAMFGQATYATRGIADDLSRKHVNTAKLEAFFAECYQRDFREIHEDPKNNVERRRNETAKERFGQFSERFERELDLIGASWWNAFNAYTGFIQHDLGSTIKKSKLSVADRREQRVSSNLLGVNARRSTAALETALELAS